MPRNKLNLLRSTTLRLNPVGRKKEAIRKDLKKQTTSLDRLRRELSKPRASLLIAKYAARAAPSGARNRHGIVRIGPSPRVVSVRLRALVSNRTLHTRVSHSLLQTKDLLRNWGFSMNVRPLDGRTVLKPIETGDNTVLV
jgi:hypothetical protein